MPQNEDNRFKELYDLIVEQARAMESPELTSLLPSADRTIAYKNLVLGLNDLRIPYAEPMSYDFLTELAVLSSKGALEEARQLAPNGE